MQQPHTHTHTHTDILDKMEVGKFKTYNQIRQKKREIPTFQKQRKPE